jgi:hypothetical protein
MPPSAGPLKIAAGKAVTPLLFSAGSPIWPIVPPMRSNRSPSATCHCSRRPFQKYST